MLQSFASLFYWTEIYSSLDKECKFFTHTRVPPHTYWKRLQMEIVILSFKWFLDFNQKLISDEFINN